MPGKPEVASHRQCCGWGCATGVQVASISMPSAARSSLYEAGQNRIWPVRDERLSVWRPRKRSVRAGYGRPPRNFGAIESSRKNAVGRSQDLARRPSRERRGGADRCGGRWAEDRRPQKTSRAGVELDPHKSFKGRSNLRTSAPNIFAAATVRPTDVVPPSVQAGRRLRTNARGSAPRRLPLKTTAVQSHRQLHGAGIRARPAAPEAPKRGASHGRCPMRSFPSMRPTARSSTGGGPSVCAS